jgi:hypothetical protein
VLTFFVQLEARSTSRKNGMNAIDSLRMAIDGTPFIPDFVLSG